MTTSLTHSQPSARRLQTFRSLRHRNYRLWFFGQGISLIGSWMQIVAQQVLVYRLTGSALALGMTSFIGILPLLPFSLWGGSLADRLPKRSVLLVTQAIMLVQALVLAGLTYSGTVQMGHVYGLVILLSAVQAVDIPVRLAFTVEMVEGKEDLTNAIALNSAQFNAARAVGPALAGMAVAATGEATAFLVNGLTFIPVLLSLMLMRNLPAPSGNVRGPRSSFRHVIEGAAYIRRERTLLVLISLVAVSAVLAMPYTTLMPVFADTILGPTARPLVQVLCTTVISCRAPEALPLGLLLATVGVGAVVGALLVASLPANTPRGRWLTAGNLVFPATLVLFSLNRSFLLALPILFVAGMGFVAQNALANTLLQLQAPDHLRGRVMSFYALAFQTTMRVGGLQAGILAERWGAVVAVAAGAILALMYGLVIAVAFPAIRRLR